MPTMLLPVRVPETGDKLIQELTGALSTGQDGFSVARMTAPAGWDEPGQRPEFDELSYVLAGELVVQHEGGELSVGAGECILTRAGEWVRYAAGPGGAEYLAVCAPAFTTERAHRDD